ncbi:hypothetical protein IJT10_07930 [bacterium]|nr:hypothetical protein [bacterium]
MTVKKINRVFNYLIDSGETTEALKYFDELIKFDQDALDYNSTLVDITINSGKQDYLRQNLLEQVCQLYDKYEIRSDFTDLLRTGNLKQNNVEELMQLRFVFDKSIQRALGFLDRDWRKYYVLSQIFEDLDICLAIYLNGLALKFIPCGHAYLQSKLDLLIKLARKYAKAGSLKQSLVYYKYIFNVIQFHPLPINRLLEINLELFSIADKTDDSAQIAPILLSSPQYYQYTLSALPLVNYACIRAREFEKNLLYIEQMGKHIKIPEWLSNILRLQGSVIKFLIDNRKEENILESSCLNLLLNEIENTANQNDQIKLVQLMVADTFLALGSSSKAILYLERAQRLTLQPLISENKNLADFDPDILKQFLEFTKLSARLNLSAYNSEEEALFDLYVKEERYREAQKIAERALKKYSFYNLEFVNWQIKMAKLQSIQGLKDKDKDLYEYSYELLEEKIAHFNHFDPKMINSGTLPLDPESCQGPCEYYVYLSQILQCTNLSAENDKLGELYDMLQKICATESSNVILLRELIKLSSLFEEDEKSAKYMTMLGEIATNVYDLQLCR